MATETTHRTQRSVFASASPTANVPLNLWPKSKLPDPSIHSAVRSPIALLSSDKSKREEAEYQRRNAAVAMGSPSFPFSCPPPPYSHPPTANAGPTAPSGLLSPPESRRTSGDDAVPVLPTRLSLPSIHEALGGSDPVLPYPPHASAPPTPGGLVFYQPAAAAAMSDLHRRSFVTIPPPQQESHHPYTHLPPHNVSSPYMSRPPQMLIAQHAPTSTPDMLSRPPLYASQQLPKLPTLQPDRTGASPVHSLRPNLAHPPQRPSSSSLDAIPQSVAPPGGPYGHPSFPQSNFTFSAPAPTSGPGYPTAGAAPTSLRYPPAPAWRSENDIRAMEERQRTSRIGESIKRNLEDFQLEVSLNEIAESSGRLLEFAREHGTHAHANQRAGQSVQSIPQLQAVDDLMLKSRKIQDSLLRIRDVILAQDAAMEEQMKDSSRNLADGFASDANSYSDESKGSGGFAGPDLKKRRGRAAPPGRCHSCNRAETPEWRRGPDGARTLCNACGLHYAKLTRKLGGNKTVIGNSSLRPKPMGPGSPSG